jgi:murein DD-endopeptidase MepM/ murein hydrolase activator NlpD
MIDSQTVISRSSWQIGWPATWRILTLHGRSRVSLHFVKTGIAVIVAVAVLMIGYIPSAAGFGSTPALQLPWGFGQARNVSGFTYGSANQVCGGVPTTHTGLERYAIDFGLNFEEVDAAAYGTVGAEGYTSGGGYYMWIQHQRNVQTYYGHLSAYSVTVGTIVYKGQPIATSGNSGPPGTGAHIHFRVTTGGTGPFTGTAYMPEPMGGLGPPGYTGWQNYGCNIDTNTTFTSTPPNQQVNVNSTQSSNTDVFIRGGDGGAWHSPTNSSGLPNGWETLGGTIQGTPVGVAVGPGTRIDAYALGQDASVWHDIWITGTWYGWNREALNQTSGSSETEEVTATRALNGTIDLFIRGVNGDGWHAKTDGGGEIVSWESIGGGLKGAPVGSWNWQNNTLDVYAIGINDQVFHRILWSDGTWSGWLTTTNAQASGQSESEMVTSARRSDGTMDLFLRASNGAPLHSVTDSDGNPGPWLSLGGSIKGTPWGQWNGSILRVYAVGLGDGVFVQTWNGSSWSGWVQGSGITA